MDTDRVSKLLGEVSGSLGVAKKVSLSPGEFLGDDRNTYALRMAIVEIVEAAATLGLRLLRERFGVKSVESYAEVFEKLAEHGVLSRDVGEGMKSWLGLETWLCTDTGRWTTPGYTRRLREAG